jgi:hypothetical protein
MIKLSSSSNKCDWLINDSVITLLRTPHKLFFYLGDKMPVFDLHPERCEKVIEAQLMTPSRQTACFNTAKKEVHLYTSFTPTNLPLPPSPKNYFGDKVSSHVYNVVYYKLSASFGLHRNGTNRAPLT